MGRERRGREHEKRERRSCFGILKTSLFAVFVLYCSEVPTKYKVGVHHVVAVYCVEC